MSASQNTGTDRKTRDRVRRLCFAIAWLLIALCGIRHARAQCVISPSTPTPVLTNGTQQFTASCGTGLTYSVTGVGGINSSTGLYTAPTNTQAQNLDHGCQVSPENSPYNIPITSLPVDSHSARWIARIADDSPEFPIFHSYKFYPQLILFYSNPVNASTPTQPMQFYYASNSNGYEGASFPMPLPRDLVMETGTSVNAGDGYDRHLLTIDPSSNCTETETYNRYVDFRTVSFTAGNPTVVTWTTNTVYPIPQGYQVYITGGTGSWAAANGTWTLTLTGSSAGTLPFNSTGWGPAGATIMTSLFAPYNVPANNSQSGQKFSPGSYAALGGVDAAGMSINAATVKAEEWYAATQAGRNDLGHAIRTTLSNAYLSARPTWPATLNAGAVDGFVVGLNSCTNANPTVCTLSGDMSASLACTPYSWINAITGLTVASGGTGYQVNDEVLINGGTNGYAYVSSVGAGGVITGLAIVYGGTGYTAGVQSVLYGSGSGATANVAVTTNCSFAINVSGMSGGWTGLNGDQTATTITNSSVSIAVNASGFGTFPAGGYFVPDFLPYGATFRLKSSVNVNSLCSSTDLNTWCPYAKVYLRTLQNYGLILADGTGPSDNWDSGVMSSEFHPNQLVDASLEIRSWAAIQPLETYLDVVNRSSQWGPALQSPPNPATDLPSWQQSNVNRTTVTVTGSAGSASVDVLLQGTAVGTDKERLTIVAGTSYPLGSHVWVTGDTNTSVSYAISGISGATITGGTLTMPGCSTMLRGTVTVTAANANALPLYIEVTCLPVNSDGSIRLALGNYNGNYVDAGGHTWYGAYPATTGCLYCNTFNNSYEGPGALWATQNGTWQGYLPCANDTWSGTDSQLYSRSTNVEGDSLNEVTLPNATYTITFYGEPGFGGYGAGSTCGTSAGENLFDWVVQGTTIVSNLDGYTVAGGNYRGYQETASAVAVSDNNLDIVSRNRAVSSTYGPSTSSLLITSGAPPPTITVSCPLPSGTVGVSYSGSCTASGGTSPYTWATVFAIGTACSGVDVAGLSMAASTGIYSGTPAKAGICVVSVHVTDSLGNSPSPHVVSVSIAPSPSAVRSKLGGQSKIGGQAVVH